MKKQASDNNQTLSYSQAIEQLEKIVEQLQNPDCDIDLLRDYTKQAITLLQFCKERLNETDEEVKKLLHELGAES
ncbi:MAG: exodeoxyribonuclease VII small subunit [Bacteroidaceae bacterium]|nr:exodeoxyribonuclease VII small subunit [Bacteroidaceae bacterium]